MIADYKHKKLITEELLANADLDGISDGAGYDDGKFEGSDNESNEEEANQVMDQMIEQYKLMGKSKRPPAVA